MSFLFITNISAEPHERKSVYVDRSTILGAGEGTFARRTFLPGHLVSYYNGVKLREDQMFLSNMTQAALHICHCSPIYEQQYRI